MPTQESYINLCLDIKEDDNLSLWFIYKDNKLLMKKHKSNIQVPTLQECTLLKENLENILFVGISDNILYYCAEISDSYILPNTLEWGSLKDERWIDNNDVYLKGIKSYQLLSWNNSSKYCGKCGTLTDLNYDEQSKKCPNCAFTQYPRISPAIIVGIKNKDKILLAHNSNFTEGLYSVIAGFVEQGETLEETVKREVFEEVGIKIKNVTYFGSSPWSTEDSLMIGFIADYESGEIKVDNKEILMANWYSNDSELPILPSKLTIARAIIDYLLK